MAMAMQLDPARLLGKYVASNFSAIGFTRDEFIDQECILAEIFGRSNQVVRNEVRYLIPEAQDRRWFNPNQRGFACNGVFKQFDVPDCQPLSVPE
jgi:hypothetical protein